MKAILVIDMPEKCEDCPLTEWAGSYCRLIGMFVNDERPSWCPLKPMPQKKEVEVNEIEDIMHTEYSVEDIYTNKYVATILLATDKLISLGWNACIDEILGETK